jgi:hypothetical protein
LNGNALAVGRVEGTAVATLGPVLHAPLSLGIVHVAFAAGGIGDDTLSIRGRFGTGSTCHGRHASVSVAGRLRTAGQPLSTAGGYTDHQKHCSSQQKNSLKSLHKVASKKARNVDKAVAPGCLVQMKINFNTFLKTNFMSIPKKD